MVTARKRTEPALLAAAEDNNLTKIGAVQHTSSAESA
jgi:hypothetical protein